MTVVVGQKYLMQGVILTADSRISKGSDPWRDNAQKLFRLKDHLFIGFSGHVALAGEIIGFLFDELQKTPILAKPGLFQIKGPKLIKYKYKALTKNMLNPPYLGFLVAGVDYSRPMKMREADGALSNMAGTFESRLFAIDSPVFQVREATRQRPILYIGSGSPAVAIEEPFLTEFQFELMNRPLVEKGMLTISILEQKMLEVGISSVGGMYQLVTLDRFGSTFHSYKARGPHHRDPNTLDRELLIQNGRYIQRNLITGQEMPLLYPPEVIENSHRGSELFSRAS